MKPFNVTCDHYFLLSRDHGEVSLKLIKELWKDCVKLLYLIDFPFEAIHLGEWEVDTQKDLMSLIYTKQQVKNMYKEVTKMDVRKDYTRNLRDPSFFKEVIFYNERAKEGHFLIDMKIVVTNGYQKYRTSMIYYLFVKKNT